ncbi:hypothetical protein DNTS_021186, partial [Danionella cerebrum]
SKEICSTRKPLSQISRTDCSIDVPEIYRRCNGLHVCELDYVGRAPSDPCLASTRGYSSLRCETGKIQLNTVYYGRRDKTTCSQGRPSSQLQNTACYTQNKLASLSKSCNDKESCEVAAGDTTDCCFGIYKYLEITYFCNSVYSSIACADQECPDLLSKERPSMFKAPTNVFCWTTYVSVLLNCNILASNSVFSDPCVNGFKYLNISH